MFKNRRPIGGTEEVVEGCRREAQEIAAGGGGQGLYRLSMGVVENLYRRPCMPITSPGPKILIVVPTECLEIMVKTPPLDLRGGPGVGLDGQVHVAEPQKPVGVME